MKLINTIALACLLLSPLKIWAQSSEFGSPHTSSAGDINLQPISGAALDNTDFRLDSNFTFTRENWIAEQALYKRYFHNGAEITAEEARLPGASWCALYINGAVSGTRTHPERTVSAVTVRARDDSGRLRALHVHSVDNNLPNAANTYAYSLRSSRVRLSIPGVRRPLGIDCQIHGQTRSSHDIPQMTVGDMRRHLNGVIDLVPVSTDAPAEEI